MAVAVAHEGPNESLGGQRVRMGSVAGQETSMRAGNGLAVSLGMRLRKANHIEYPSRVS